MAIDEIRTSPNEYVLLRLESEEHDTVYIIMRRRDKMAVIIEDDAECTAMVEYLMQCGAPVLTMKELDSI